MNYSMKKWIENLKKFLFPENTMMGISTYNIKYVNNLTPIQMNILLNQMVNEFPPNCKPNRLTVSTSLLSVQFSQPCMSGESMKNAAERTLEKNKPNTVEWVKLDGRQIWPEV